MRTDELIRSLETRGERGTSGAATGGVTTGAMAQQVVADAGRAAVRRHRTQRTATAVAATVVLVAVGVAGWQSIAGSDRDLQVITEPDESPPDPVMSTLEELPMIEHNGVGLRVPDGWRTSGEDLTPNVINPTVIASFGTAPLSVGGGENCAQFPMAAVLAMGTDDVLAVLHERSGGPDDRPTRGRSLWDGRGAPNGVTAVDCPEWPDGVDVWWIRFQDGGRLFYLFVVVGPDVPQERLVELAASVDALYVEPAEGTEPSPAVREQEPTSPPPHPLPLTGAIGHVVTINDAQYLIGTSGSGSRRTIEIATDDLVLVGAATDSIHGAIAMSDSSAWGVVSAEVVRVEVVVGDRRFESEVVALPFDPAVRIWVVEAPGQILRSPDEEVRVTYLDADGNEVIPEPPDGK